MLMWVLFNSIYTKKIRKNNWFLHLNENWYSWYIFGLLKISKA